MTESGVQDSSRRQVPINFCNMEDLLAVGATPDQARGLLGLREEYGSLTPELFEASEIPVEVKMLADHLNFWPKAPAGQPSSPDKLAGSDHEDEFHTRSEAATFCSSTPKMGATRNEEPPNKHSPYPFDVYPPPGSETEGRGSGKTRPPPSQGRRPPPRGQRRDQHRGRIPGYEKETTDSQEFSKWGRGGEGPQAKTPGRDNREYDTDEDDWEGDRGRNRREYGQGRDNRDHEGEDEPDYPTTPRGRSTPRASRSPPFYEPGRDDREWEDVADVPPAPRGHTTARTSRNTPRHQAPQARDDGRRYQANAKAPSYQPLPKSITFNGSGNWRAFYRKFDAFAKQMSWGYPQRLNQLSWCLEGRAIDFFDLVLGREPRLNYVEVVERMGRRFDYQEPPEAAQLEFSTARQGAEEPLLEWADRVHALAARAFSEVQDGYAQRQMVLRLCQGCVDKDAGCHALDRHPITMDEAVEAINWHHHSRRAIYGRSRQTKVLAVSSGNGEEPRICQGDGTPDRSHGREEGMRPPSKLERRVTHLEELLENLGKTVATLVKKVYLLVEQAVPPPVRGQHPNHRGSLNPWFVMGVESPGHLRRDCPRPRSSTDRRVAFVATEESGNSSGSEEEVTLRPSGKAHDDHQH